jgi:rare lipoprotein A
MPNKVSAPAETGNNVPPVRATELPVMVTLPAALSSVIAPSEHTPLPISAPSLTQPSTALGAATLPATTQSTPANTKKLRPTVKSAIAKPAKHPKVSPPRRRASAAHESIAAFNRPYLAFGEQYVPLATSSNFYQRGEATWYSKTHQGQPTINNEIYDVYGMTAGHPTLPIPSYARVTNLSNHKSVVVRINDRGPFNYNKKIIELSFSAANKIGMVGSSNRQVEVVGLESDTPAPIKTRPPITFNLTPERGPAKSTKPPVKLSTKIVAQKSTPPATPSDAGIYLQLGAFKTATAAQSFKQKMDGVLGQTAYPLTNALQDKLHRVRIGPYPSQDAARRAAEEMVKPLGFKPIVKQVN